MLPIPQKKYEFGIIEYFAKLPFPFRISKCPGCETNILNHFCTFVKNRPAVKTGRQQQLIYN